MRRFLLAAILIAIAPLLFGTSASAQELKLFGGGHFQTAGQPLAEAFSEKSGIATSYTGGNTGNGGMMRRIEAGEIMDVIVMNRDEMDEQAQAGNIKPDSVASFGRDRMGLAVPAGEPAPDISTPERLREVLLAARSVGMQEPDPMGHSGKNILEVLTNLGIADEITSKGFIYERGADAFSDGSIDIGFWSYPELLRREGIEVLGPTPMELGGFTEQAVGIPTSSENDADARAFIQYLISVDAEAVYRHYGLDPLPATQE
jgi:molybdate transport system substrate-binding protein